MFQPLPNQAATRTVSGVLVEILKKHGVRHIFGLPALQMAMIIDSITSDPYFR